MQHELIARPSMTVAKLTLHAGESVTCEVGAMVAMSSGFEVETTSKSRGGGGGFRKGLKRMFSGESYFLNHFTATASNQMLMIGPSMLGDIVHHPLSGGSLVVQGGSWLASDQGIEIDTTWQGLGKGLLGGESMFWVKCSGTGDVLLNSFGAIHEIEVNGEYVVDTGHIVAFDDTLQFNLGKAGSSWICSFLGG
jgi:uncharacterized protein (TIGR00266 family)